MALGLHIRDVEPFIITADWISQCIQKQELLSLSLFGKGSAGDAGLPASAHAASDRPRG